MSENPKRKRLRPKPKHKPGELKICWGGDGDGGEDIIMCWGDGTRRADARLLYGALFNAVCRSNIMQANNLLEAVKYEDSIAKQLQDRGYGLTTLRVTIQKQNPDNPTIVDDLDF